MLTPTNEFLYFRDINKIKLLSRRQEQKLLHEVKNDNKSAIDKLVSANLRFVVSIANKYRGRGLTYLELINEGNMGLIKAAKHYNAKMHVKFISYAVWWIRQAIQKALIDQRGTIRIPPNKVSLIHDFKRELSKNNGNYHKTLQMEEFHGKEWQIVEAMDKMYTYSLEAPLSNDSENESESKTLEDVLGQEEKQSSVFFHKELLHTIEEALNLLPDKDQKIVCMYFGIKFPRHFTLEEIGGALDISRERVRHIRDRALRKIFRNQTARKKLAAFL